MERQSNLVELVVLTLRFAIQPRGTEAMALRSTTQLVHGMVASLQYCSPSPPQTHLATR